MFATAASLLLPPEPPSDDDYATWLTRLFPSYVTAPLAEHHHRIWRWVYALKRGTSPKPLVVLLPRGGAKSTTVELACVAVGYRKTRRYVLYVSGTQPQADDHVQNVGALLESDALAADHPALSERMVGKYGASKGWRRNRLRTADGLIVDALGLDVAARGVKLEEQRPDLIVFDDVDDTEDSVETTIPKKIRAITQKILPAGSSDVAVMFVQNVVHYESIAARLAGLASEPADFMLDREVIGPLPALRGAEFEQQPDGRWLILRGEPIWEGQDLAICQDQVNRWGIRAFRSEAQHERTPPEGQAFPEFDRSIHVVEPFPIPEAWPKWSATDYGYSSPWGTLWFAWSPTGRIYVYRERYGVRQTAREQAYTCRLASAGEQLRFAVGDPSMWASQREGQKFMSVADQYGEMEYPLTPASNDRLAGKARVHDVLNGSLEVPPVVQIFSTCHNLIRTLPMLPVDPHKPEDVDTLAEDHLYDCLRYGVVAAHWTQYPATMQATSVTLGSGRQADDARQRFERMQLPAPARARR